MKYPEVRASCPLDDLPDSAIASGSISLKVDGQTSIDMEFTEEPLRIIRRDMVNTREMFQGKIEVHFTSIRFA